jgi:hypothetical protein
MADGVELLPPQADSAATARPWLAQQAGTVLHLPAEPSPMEFGQALHRNMRDVG